jgi:hypothetical protein
MDDPSTIPTTVTSDPIIKMTKTFPETSESSQPVRTPITIPVIVNLNTVRMRFTSGVRSRERQLYWHLLDNLDVKSFQRGHSSRVIGQQANSLQVQIGKDLRSQPNLALNLALAFGQRRQAAFAVKR